MVANVVEKMPETDAKAKTDTENVDWTRIIQQEVAKYSVLSHSFYKNSLCSIYFYCKYYKITNLKSSTNIYKYQFNKIKNKFTISHIFFSTSNHFV